MIFACKSDRIGSKPVECIVEYRESISLKKYSMTFSEIEDGRCPENANCFTGGSVYTDLKFTSTKSDLPDRQLKLCLGDCFDLRKSGIGKPQVANIVLDGTKYLFTLLEANPYPATSEAAQQKDKYEIKLKIQTTP